MSKEILFRGKRFDNGEWVISDCIMKIENPCLWASLDGWVDIIPETLGQFTGLMDKNGKKIFYGDIVEVVFLEERTFWTHQGIKYGDEWEMIEKVIFNEKISCFMLEIDNKWIPMFRPLHDLWNNVFIKTIEVIGNVTDNPELVE